MNQPSKTRLRERKIAPWALTILTLTLMLALGAGGNVTAQKQRGKTAVEQPAILQRRIDRIASTIHNPQSETTSHTVTYSYDDAGRLTGVDYGGGKSITYTYDNAGNLQQRCALTANYVPDANVNIAEIMDIARRWGAGIGDPLYDAAYDLDGSGLIDLADIQEAANQWQLC